MTSSKLLDFPPITNQLILFLSSAYWGPPSPTPCGRHILKSPKITTKPVEDEAKSVAVKIWLLLHV